MHEWAPQLAQKRVSWVASTFCLGFFILTIVLADSPSATALPLFKANVYAIPAFARKYGMPCSSCHASWQEEHGIPYFRANAGIAYTFALKSGSAVAGGLSARTIARIRNPRQKVDATHETLFCANCGAHSCIYRLRYVSIYRGRKSEDRSDSEGWPHQNTIHAELAKNRFTKRA